MKRTVQTLRVQKMIPVTMNCFQLLKQTMVSHTYNTSDLARAYLVPINQIVVDMENQAMEQSAETEAGSFNQLSEGKLRCGRLL